ncbi:MAG TPA: GTPase Era [Deinococcales bacterium]|nr:GTPase Era [Deinococcales bacterium]
MIGRVTDSAARTYAGFVAIVGKPNVGKSTLLNAFLGVKVAPTSPKPQTTRRGVRGIFTEEDRQVVFVDTPGLHKPKDALGKYMNQEVHSALADVDAVVWVVDLRHPPTDEDELVGRSLRGLKLPLWMVGNKVDAAKYPDEAMRRYADLLEGSDFTQRKLSAQADPKAVRSLLGELLAVLPENPFFFPESSRSDQSREQWAAELIREEAMKALRHEIPYAVAVRVTEWEEREGGEKPGMQVIHADVIVERQGHKAIVIGKGGTQLREIGRAARKQLEVFLARPVFLDLNVEVINDWRSDPEALRELGYE